MSKLVNLRTVRKAQQRLAKRQAGDENAARHGRIKSQKLVEEAEKQRQQDLLDGHKRDE